MAKSAEIPGLSPADGFSAAAAKVVVVRTQELIDHAANVLDTGDIERVHDMRVATRRLRAALEVFEPCFPSDEFKPALKSVKKLADALGERRDRDVAIAHMKSFEVALAAPDRPGIASLTDRFRGEQEEANEALAAYVTQERLATLTEQLVDLARTAIADAEGSDGIDAVAVSEASRNGGGP